MNWIQRFLTAIATHKADVDAHHAQVHGADKHTDVTRELFIPANEGFIHSGTSKGYLTYATVQGGANVALIVYFTMKVPDDFVSFTKVEAVWAAGATGNMWWLLDAYYAAATESYDTHSDLPTYGATATGGNNVLNVQEPANPLTLVNLAQGDYIALEFNRNGTQANDTLDHTVELLGLLFTYIAEQ